MSFAERTRSFGAPAHMSRTCAICCLFRERNATGKQGQEGALARMSIVQDGAVGSAGTDACVRRVAAAA